MEVLFMVILPTLASVLITIAYPPQVIKNYRTKSVSDLSLLFWIIITVFCICMIGNALYLYVNGSGSLGYVITEGINLFFAATVLIQIIYYKHFYKGKREMSEVEKLKAIIRTQNSLLSDKGVHIETPESKLIK